MTNASVNGQTADRAGFSASGGIRLMGCSTRNGGSTRAGGSTRSGGSGVTIDGAVGCQSFHCLDKPCTVVRDRCQQ